MARIPLILAALIAVATIPPRARASTDPFADWLTILERFVDRSGRVDFKALSADSAALDRFLAWVESTAPWIDRESFPTSADALSFHLNAYNALAMRGVLRAERPEALTGALARFRFFRAARVRVGGRTMSLHNCERDVIRRFDEPRVHFALNCMTRGCPRLQREPFRAPLLAEQLEAVTREFLNEDRNVQLEAGGRIVRLSEIFKWFRKDFAPDGTDAGVIGFVNRYRREPLPVSASLRFIPYDWSVIHQGSG